MRSGARTWQRSCAVTLAMATLMTGCWWGGDDAQPTPTTSAGPTDAPIVSVAGRGDPAAAAIQQLGLRLSEGKPAADAAAQVAVVDGEALTQADIDAIFARLPEWNVPATDRTDFNRPTQTLPPPLVGDTIDTPFPPATDGGGPVPPTSGPLHVLRYQPEGAVDIAPFLSVTFDQPMVPLATLEQLDAADIPARVTPAIEGRWRWIGTRTLRFELVPGAIDRLPAATSYRVEVPAGTTAANGAKLAETVTWTFSTPTPTVTGFTGEADSMPLDPVFVAVFDQRVDAGRVLGVTRLTADGAAVPIRAATAAEVAADDAARLAVAGALDARAVAFVPTTTLPPDAEIKVTIGPNIPSAEGPLASPTSTSFSGRTYGRLQVTGSSCSYGGDCVPGAPWTIQFSNPLDPTTFRTDQISVDPAVPGLRINVSGATIELAGATEGRRSYTVRLAADLRDVFGQTLGDDTTIDFRVGAAPPALSGSAAPMDHHRSLRRQAVRQHHDGQPRVGTGDRLGGHAGRRRGIPPVPPTASRPTPLQRRRRGRSCSTK